MSGQRQGTSMVEVIVALGLLSVILTALAGVTVTSARQMVRNTDASTLHAASLESVNRFTTIPFATLSAAAGCDTVGTQNNRFQRCVTVRRSGNSAVVEVVTRALQRFAVPDTVRFTRVVDPAADPLCMGC
jgi:Tfp pilus assembly protein PilV